MLKGPTGCGKTRLVELMAASAGVPLFTVSCHEDMTACDLLGRYVLTGGSTEWVDGPLTSAVRLGGICYLDEIVEARQDATVVIHSVTDHRRELNLERLGGERLFAADGFSARRLLQPGLSERLEGPEILDAAANDRYCTYFPPPESELEYPPQGIGSRRAGRRITHQTGHRDSPPSEYRDSGSRLDQDVDRRGRTHLRGSVFPGCRIGGDRGAADG